MKTWEHIVKSLTSGIPVVLLWVLHSEGSSPGRKGFKMVVTGDDLFGTIGGGIMEHKLVEKARGMLKAGAQGVELVRQYHDKEHTKDRSGMICSGSQLVAFVTINKTELDTFSAFAGLGNSFVLLNNKGISFQQTSSFEGLQQDAEDDWRYAEKLYAAPVIHIIGGGHVSLALSEMLCILGFYIKVYDDREDLNTLITNSFANEKIITDYENIGEIISSAPMEYVVIMTMGYRDDLVVFRQLLKKEFYYLGMLGSEKKIETLFEQLSIEGINSHSLKKYFIPVGLQIFSKTPAEIAVSIAAEIIREKNRHLPTGRLSVAKNLADENG